MKWEEEGENGQSEEEIKFTIWEGGYISSVPYQAMDDMDARTAGFCTMSVLSYPARPAKVGEEGEQQFRGGLITFFFFNFRARVCLILVLPLSPWFFLPSFLWAEWWREDPCATGE